MRDGSPWPRASAVIALLLAVLIGPALVVLALDGSGGDGEDALRVARLPTDVAVESDTVWVASGRDDRIVAIDVAQPEDPPAGMRPGPRRCASPSAPARSGPPTRVTTA